MPPRRPPAPFNATKKDARDDTKAAVRAFKDHRRMMPTNPLGGIGRELDARMEKVGDGERYLDDATEAAQSNEDSAAEIVRNAEGVQDDVRLEPEKVGEDARTAKLVVDGELKESLEIVRSLIEAQPNLAGALQTIFPSGDQRAVDQYEPILERLGAAERHLEASEKDVARAAEQYSTEETSHKAAKRAYLDDREAWKRQRLELTAEVEGRKDEIEWMGRTIDDVKAESSTTKTILETERLQRTELEERVAAQEAKIKWLRDEFSKAKHDLEAERIKLNQSLAAQQTSLQQKDEEHAAQTSKLQDDLAATRLQLSDNAQVRHRQLARIRELEVAFVDDVASVDNELSMAKHQLEVNETERNRVQDKCDELERDLDDFRRHNGELQAKVSRRDGRLMQANDILGELQVFRDTVIGWHGLSGDDITNDLAQEFVEVANIASQMGDWPIMSHSLDGLQLTYAGDGPTTNYGLRKQMVRFWCQCRAGEVDYVAANNMLNARLSESVEWSAVPFLYKAFGILLGRWTQVSISSLDEVPERYVHLLLRGLLSMATLGALFPPAVPADMTLQESLPPAILRVRGWLYTNPSSLTAALMLAVKPSLTEVPSPSTHHAIVLDAVKARKDHLDSSNSDLQAEITLAVDRSDKTMLLFVEEPITGIIQFTKQHVERVYREDWRICIELDHTSMGLPESTHTLRLGRQPNVSGWVALNLSYP